MASKRGHIYQNWLYLTVTTVLLIYWFQWWLLLFFLPFAVFWGLFPDIDQLEKHHVEKIIYRNIKHRWAGTHSLLLNLGLWGVTVLVQEPFFALFAAYLTLGVGCHLLSDAKIVGDKGGFYTIKFTRNRGLNGFWSTVWLLANFLLSVVILIITIVWVM